MSFSEWREVNLEQISNMKYGKMPKKNKIIDKGYPIYTGYKIAGFYDEYMFENPELLVVARGVGGTGDVKIAPPKSYITNLSIILLLDELKADKRYLFYNLGNENLRVLDSGSAQSQITIADLKRYKITLPPLPEQKAIAHILSTLDEKIEVNNQINKTLENIAQTIFKQWFVDFEFPNGAGEPYKSSGGEMVESELGMIPKGWEVKKLEDIIDLHDSKRIPLSKNEREKRDNIYPYYGAASLMDYVDEYIFDGVYVLLGEDGTVITPSGQPILQYVWGKFWVNNHAHVLTGLNNISTNFIYILLKNINVSGAVTGAVQLKINQKNLKEIKIVLPKNNDLISNYSNLLDKSFKKLRLISDENKVLIELRDSLLPKLMSGEIRVPIEEN